MTASLQLFGPLFQHSALFIHAHTLFSDKFGSLPPVGDPHPPPWPPASGIRRHAQSWMIHSTKSTETFAGSDSKPLDAAALTMEQIGEKQAPTARPSQNAAV
jgi:hypothetical protein